MTVRPAVAGPESLRVHESRAMGSPLRLTVPEASSSDQAWQDVRDEFEIAEQAMSRFRDTSELTRLNRVAGHDQPQIVSTRLRRALTTAERARRMTGGRFDPRILVALDRLGYQGAPLEDRPESEMGDPVVPCVRPIGRAALTIDAPIDLGGVGKGLALRWAARRVEERGLHTFLLEAGGDLVARGRPPDGEAWMVGIEDPAGGQAPRAAIAAGPSTAVATSSVRVHRWSANGRDVHHLLDPSTGEPGGGGLAAVTVAGSDPAWAEIWSKSLFLAGPQRIGPEARARGLAAWWIDQAGGLGMTPAGRLMTAWVAGEN